MSNIVSPKAFQKAKNKSQTREANADIPQPSPTRPPSPKTQAHRTSPARIQNTANCASITAIPARSNPIPPTRSQHSLARRPTRSRRGMLPHNFAPHHPAPPHIQCSLLHSETIGCLLVYDGLESREGCQAATADQSFNRRASEERRAFGMTWGLGFDGTVALKRHRFGFSP
ncbi:hypothetical protein K458DRAFT_155682 [Lentithecium fluviatile CBS 122367]|uniref:Uncharacterized protein n=1 Tax=Lentithecium fluviatile CBS 122367 TaxID=1168545 RepID=A0A6G1IHQ8_9PLEO|nr:hypothetical protein K458DRAFT_155682 [Lentithecium fluviatile CBS 122367]